MNIISLKYFVELAKELHVTNTAKKLYISQQNLTQHIQRLEDNYGVTLFHRKPKLSLTYAGELLLNSAQKILSEEITLINKFSDISDKGIGKLRIGIPSYRAQISLPQILQFFYKKWPNISIETTDQNSEKLENMLFTNEIDIFIGIMPKYDPRLNVIPLLKDTIHIVACDSLLKKYFGNSYENLKDNAKKGINISIFSEFPFLLPKAPSRLRQSIDTCFREADLRPNIYFEAMTTDILLPLYPHGYGAFFCTHTRLNLLKNMYKDVNAFPLYSNDELVYHNLVLAHHQDQAIYSHVADFIDITQSVFKKIEKERI
ncbi:LysR family transcriptional regulator [Fusobacterium sp. PH5-44]|uniref:LysR family transcriptional regulator n=1 Tax=unclassified Fusobacterium TaxID=2648384 RepID=UPI003D254696